MKYCFLSLMLMICTIGAYSQNSEKFNPKILEKYSAKELKKLAETNPDSLMILNYLAEKGYYFMDIPVGKAIEFNKLDNVKNIDLESFNPFKYNISLFKEKQNYYILGDTGKLLVIMSLKDIIKYSRQEKIRNNEN